MRDYKSENLDINIDYLQYFKKLWDGYLPLVYLFKNESGNYLYDNGTNKIIRCKDPEFKVITNLIQGNLDEGFQKLLLEMGEEIFSAALKSVVNAIESEKILQSDPRKIRFGSKHFEDNYEDYCLTSLGQLILEVTQGCNLRCEYCVYNPQVSDTRKHNNQHMDLETAKAAIDYLVKHSKNSENVYISFYGGEPMLQYPLIQECVSYAKRLLKDKNLSFSMTTNGLLLNQENVDYLYNESFNVMVSIDGPQEIHDEYRKDIHGNGTFQRALRGVEFLVNRFGEETIKRLNLSMVYTPPFGEKRLNRIMELWNEYPWLKDIGSSISYPHAGSIPLPKLHSPSDWDEDKEVSDFVFDRYINDYREKKKSKRFDLDFITNSLIKIFRRAIFPEPNYIIYLNGCCYPAERKIFVNVDGDFYLCERIHIAGPSIGNIYTGLDYKKLKDVYINEYGKESIGDCSNCWANRLCGACYMDSYAGQKFNLKKKKFRCESILNSSQKLLNIYTILLDIDPEGLNWMAEVKVS